MKKQIQLIVYMSVLAVMLSACGQSYEDKAKEWLRSNVEHIVNINDNHRVLYCVKNETPMKDIYGTDSPVAKFTLMRVSFLTQ